MDLNQNQTGPFAIRRLVRNPDGTMSVVYIDPKTGQQVSNLAGYQIVEPDNAASLSDLGLDPNKQKTEAAPTAPSTADKVKEAVAEPRGESQFQNNAQPMERLANDNYGYFNKPTGFGLAAGALGGMFGTMVDKGINLNNAVAIDEARKSMGLESKGLGGLAKDTLFGSKDGRVADVNIGPHQFSVGFEALDKYGRTSMTPEEARRRSAALDQPIVEATKDQVRADVKAFKEDYKTSKGNTVAGALAGGISDLVAGVGDFFNGLFDGGTKSAPKDTYSDWGLSDFPEAPNSPSGNSGSKETNQTTYGEFIGIGAFDNATSSNSSSNDDDDDNDYSGDYSANGGLDSPGEGKR